MASDGLIACQYKLTQNIPEMFLFDLQIIAFLVLKKARCIADIEPSEKREFRLASRLTLPPTTLQSRHA